MPTNLAVLEIFPANFFNCVVKYSFSKFSLASLKGYNKVSFIENPFEIWIDSNDLEII